MQRPTYSQFSATPNYPYPAQPYAQQQIPYNAAVQYTVSQAQQQQQQQQSHGPYYPPTTTPLAPSAPQQQPVSSTPTTRRNARPQAAPAVLRSPEKSAAQSAEPQSPDASQYGDDTLMNDYDGQRQGDNNGDEDGDEPVFHLPPPPENTYETVEDLDKAMHAWSLEHGYELVRRASKKNAKGILYKRYYHCSKHGKLANTGKLTDATRVRVNRKSNRIGCPMSLAIVAVDPTRPEGQWQIRHRKTHHNHGPLDALALAGHRRRARVGGVEKAVDGLFEIGTPTTQVLQFLQRTNPNGLFTRTDVANMKLKYKKYGSCADRRDATQPSDQRVRPVSACTGCRSRKARCDSQRPVCSSCAQRNQSCSYEHDTPDEPMAAEPTLASQLAIVESTLQQAAVPQPVPQGVPNARPPNERTEAILADLQSFQAAHVRPTKLSLQSSAVETLAACSCGNGDSYRNIQTLEHTEQWPSFKNAIIDASMKENTYEVLIGQKLEPVEPSSDDCSIEDWNEFIKQLAIFNRRNTALLGVLMPRLAPLFRQRVQHATYAFTVWQILEDACQPRGSDQAYKLYIDLHSITLQNSVDLKDYIIRLELAYEALNRINHTPADLNNSEAARRNANSVSSTSRRAAAYNVFTEEMLSFLFLRNLGPDFKRWGDGVCSTNNVAGFGTGRRLGFVELTRHAVEWQNLQQRRHEG